jgi:hypothetical protein
MFAMKKIKVFNFDEFTASVAKATKKYCWKGYRVLTSCPICFKELLSVQEAQQLVEAFSSPQNYSLVEAFTAAHSIGLLILIASNVETARLLNFRLILAPLCNHHTGIDAETIEHNIMMVSRFGEIVKDDSNISD